MEKECLAKSGRGINTVFVSNENSNEQDHDRKRLDEILAKASGILGCG